MCTRCKIWLACGHFDVKNDCCNRKTDMSAEDCHGYGKRSYQV